MSPYEQHVLNELQRWQQQMQKPPTTFDRLAKGLQRRMNRFIPQKVRTVITTVIKQMTRVVLFGADKLTRQPTVGTSLQEREAVVKTRIEFYKTTGAAEGGITGAGGILLGLADFPLLLTLKVKLLFEIAALYGFSGNDYRERLYIMHIFQLAFSSPDHRLEVFRRMQQWDTYSQSLPDDIHQFDWQTFQEEYRDYIDLAKMAQLIPGIGAAVGLVVNYRLLDKLGVTAMNAYRMRIMVKKAA
nr:EcsC family protein [uncultured Arsenicibacter sp.]